MKTRILIFLLCVITIPAFSQPLTKKEKIAKLIEMTGAVDMAINMVNEMIPLLKSNYSELDEAFWDEFMKEIKPEGFVNLIIPIYDKYFTERDIDELIAFYNSSVGKKVIRVLPKISKESQEAGEAWGREISEKVLEKLEQMESPGETE